MILKKIAQTVIATLIICAALVAASAATLSPTLQSQLKVLSNSASVGVVIISFNAPDGLKESHLNTLRLLGITKGVTYPRLGMVAAALNAGQVRALANDASILSIWSNDRLVYHMNQARMLAGVDLLRADSTLTTLNGGYPVSGDPSISILVIDSGIDATHGDLPYGSKVIQNTQRVVSTDAGNTGITIAGTPVTVFTPSVSIEGIQNTDNIGHGTHCAGIAAGLGSRSAGLYEGVAPGVKIVGSGGGAVLLVIDALAGWEYGLTHNRLYNIKVITNSYGPLGGGQYNPNDPLMIAAKKAHDADITVLFSAGNDGAAKDTLSPYVQAPWVIGVAAGTKEGMLAGFSSRGLPKEERLSDDNPFNDNEYPTLTAPGNGRYYDSSLARYGFTSDIVSVRAVTNLTANGTWFPAPGADTELPPAMVPFYTQISGTSMATPFTAGVVALMLDADPLLKPDQIKQILIDTTTKMPGYRDFEVGAGYINAYAAVDKVFNRSKAYKNFAEPAFNAQFSEERPAAKSFHIDFNPANSGPDSPNAIKFDVQPGMNVLDVFANVDTVLEPGVGNFVGIRITSPTNKTYTTAIETPVIGTTAREIVVQNPEAGTWTLEVRGAKGLTAVPQASSPTQIAAPGPVEGNIQQVKYILPNIPDIADHPQRAAIEAALKDRVIDTYADGTFHPNDAVTREDLARSLALNTPLRQSIASSLRFTDVSGDLLRIAQAVTADGSTLRDYNFIPKGMMSASGTAFNPTGTVNRLDLAVALVRALGHDVDARNLAGSTVTYNGTALSDSAEIPAEYRGYVQVALNLGLFEAYPAEIIQTSPGQFEAKPGPRFEPATTLTRAALAAKLDSFRQLFIAGA
jgi:serine protease AprX